MADKLGDELSSAVVRQGATVMSARAAGSSGPPPDESSANLARPAPASPVPQRSASVRRAAQTHSHGHLWSLPDGTGLHAPYGELVIECATGQVCCHLCGRWFVSLGGHLKTHGYNANSYREAMGLCRTRRLVAEPLSKSIATRQRQAYRRSPAVRTRLAAGQELSRSGRLADLARSARLTPVSPETARIRHAALDVGRATRAARRHEALTQRLRALGVEDLADYLRREYAAGASLRGLAAVTGLGWRRLRQEIEAAGIALRPAGVSSAQRRQFRAEAQAARRVGTDDVPGWLRQRRSAGWSLTRLAEAVGHSRGWVRSRLREEPTG